MNDLMELIDAYAEARHVGGCHTYNAKTAEARAKVVAAIKLETARWPKNAAEVRAFIGNQFERLQYGKESGRPHENDRYTLTAHDFLSAVDWWADSPNFDSKTGVRK